MIDFIFTLAILTIALHLIYKSLRNGIGPMPSNAKTRLLVIKAIQDLSPQTPQHMIDLGSGWGGLFFSLSKKFPTSRVSGYENNLLPYLWVKCLLFFKNLNKKTEQTEVLFTNFFQTDWTKADIVTCYLAPDIMLKIAEQLRNQKISHSLTMISLCFSLPNHTPIHTFVAQDLFKTPVYIYRLDSTHPCNIPRQDHKT